MFYQGISLRICLRIWGNVDFHRDSLLLNCMCLQKKVYWTPQWQLNCMCEDYNLELKENFKKIEKWKKILKKIWKMKEKNKKNLKKKWKLTCFCCKITWFRYMSNFWKVGRGGWGWGSLRIGILGWIHVLSDAGPKFSLQNWGQKWIKIRERN